MKIGIISDIHSNLEALEAVVKKIEKEVDEIYCLGDIVGYGPNPNECVSYIKKINASIIGNHDAAVVGRLDYDNFNPLAQYAIDWTRENITPENFEFLYKLPEKLNFEWGGIVHGSIRKPLEEYLVTYNSVFANFNLMDENIYFFGHSHIAGVFIYENDEIKYLSMVKGGEIEIQPKNKYLINPGSVGQPRDGNWKSSFGIYDTKNHVFKVYRVDYLIEITQKKMQLLGFPRPLWERLSFGR
ncbi:MAG: serine/threonine protein phosphatase [Dictyoglomus sp. NZ13-RE01]|nr:MAG: serine/threonine protein phosphatase [Dictyoglomus sp. NZ13-RE01]